MSFDLKTVKFGNLVEFVNEKANAEDASFTNYISTENMTSNFGGVKTAATLPKSGNITRFREGDTLFSNIRTYFKKVWRANFDGYCSNDVLVFRTKNEKIMLPNFLHHLCCWEKFTEFSVRTSKGAKMPRGDKDALAQFRFDLPSLDRQSAIVSVLGNLDIRINQLKQTNQTLEAIAQTIFKSWFVNFDPVHAKQQGIPCAGIDAETVELFPDSFEDSELGQIPKGWTVKKIKDVMELSYGKSLVASKRMDGDVPVYGSSGITGYHNESYQDGPSVIIGRKGTVGSLFWEDRAFFPIDTVFFIKPKYHLTYCFYLLQTFRLENMNTDAAVPGLNRENVYRLELVLPSKEILDRFNELIFPIRNKIKAQKNQIDTLANIRDTLLPRLISGKLDVSAIKAQLEEMA